MQLMAQCAERAPLAFKSNRLVRGIAGFLAMTLACRAVATPFSGRRAVLPPRVVEALYGFILGPLSTFSYLYANPAAGSAHAPDGAAVCAHYQPRLTELWTNFRDAGSAEASRLGRGVVFTAGMLSAPIFAVEREDINACCLPGGTVLVHSGLLRALGGSDPALAFIVGHEVGHAIGRHSLEKTTAAYRNAFLIDIIMGAGERLLRVRHRRPRLDSTWGAFHFFATCQYRIVVHTHHLVGSAVRMQAVSPQADDNDVEAAGKPRLRALEGVLQAVQYVHQLSDSRAHEFEADELALHLARGAGAHVGSVYRGAEQTMQLFMRMEAGTHAAEGDDTMSTHPAAVNRLARLRRIYARGV